MYVWIYTYTYIGAIALSYPRPPLFFVVDDSGAEFHAD